MKKYLLSLMGICLSIMANASNYPAQLATFGAKSSALAFVENVGQVKDQNNQKRDDIQFRVGAAGGLNIFIGNGAIHYQFSKPDKQVTPPTKKEMMKPGFIPESVTYDMYRMDVELVGANTHAQVITEGIQDFYENYYTDWSGEQGATAHTYNKITYKNIYPNIDWVFYMKDGQMKHEFVVREGGRVADIKLKYGGASNLNLNEKGELVATTPQGIITEQSPYTYQKDGKEVHCSFKLEGTQLSYEVASFAGELIIDPALVWATYFGMGGTDIGYGVITDSSDNFLMVGSTNSTIGIATIGSYQTSFGGNTYDAFLCKFNSFGTLLWSTYYGGSGVDIVYSLDIDASGNLYIVGYTSSTSGFATSGAYQTSYGGGSFDLFLAKFSNSGARIWSTYYGGPDYEAGYRIKLDGNGNFFITGQTSSSHIATIGAYLTSRPGGSFDAFLAKFDSSGNIKWATYFGGANSDDGTGVATDGSGNVYMSGNTQSTTGIATSGSFQPYFGTGTWHSFLSKFDSSGAIQWATYFGGTDIERDPRITSDINGNVYLAGITSSSSGIATTGAYQTTIGGSPDVYIAKFNNSGSRLWATYFGGTSYDDVYNIVLNGSGNLFITGSTSSTTGIATPGAYQSSYGGSFGYYDAYMAEFNNSGSLQYASYFGGSSDDRGLGITAKGDGSVLLVGYTASTSAIATPGAYQIAHGGGTYDAFVAKFFGFTTISGTLDICVGTSTTLSGSISGGMWSSSDVAVATINPLSGVVTGIATGTCLISFFFSGNYTTALLTVSPIPISGTISGSSSVCLGSSIGLSSTATGGVWSSTSTNVSVSGSTITGMSGGSAIISYIVTTGCGSSVATKTITINSTATVGSITGASSVATGATITLSDTISGGVWSSSNSSIASVGSGTGIVTGVAAGNVVISYTITNSCGNSSATKTITVNTLILPITGPTSLCQGTSIALNDATIGGTWSSSNTSVATIGLSTGIVSGLSTGTTIITYSVSGVYVTSTVSVISSTAPISGPSSICVGASASLTNAAGGGTWSSSVPAKATIDLLSGYVTGIAAGTTIITYSVSCGISTRVITVLATPAVITGSNSICQGATTALADATPGGTWTSSNTTIATIGSTGVVTGVMGGTTIISYTISSGCVTTMVETVNSLFLSTGTTTVCKDYTTVLYNSLPGGLWSSSNIAVATVNCNLGIVKGLSPGTAIITYTLGSGCNSIIRVTVISLSKNTGTTGVCVASTTTLSNTSAGGIWYSNDSSIASVDSVSGVVTGISTGNAIITYTFGPGCATNTGITVVTLSANTGTQNVCIGGTGKINNITAGGTWSSSNPSVCSVTAATGVISGVSAGTALITYKFGNTCMTTTPITVNPLPAAVFVSGGGTFCNNTTITASGGGGDTIYFQGTTPNGTSTAIPSTSQVVTASGNYYFRARSASGCWGTPGSASVLIPVITGPTTVCTGTTAALANTGGSGGRWSSSNTAVGSVNPITGVLTGRIVGSTTIYDTLASGCVVLTPITVGSAPTITGPTIVCNGQTITLTNTATGGTWSSSAPTIATIGSTGIVTGLAAGNRATITYALGAACRSTISISVTANNPISVSGTGMVCIGQTITLTNLFPGGTWSSSDGGIATVAASTGVVTGTSLGTAIISYALPSGCITTAQVYTRILAQITGPSTVCVGQTITLADTTDGGLWSTSAPTIATVGSISGIVTGIAGNLNATLTYSLGTGCKATKIVSVNPLTPISGYSGTMCQVCQGMSLSLTEVTTGGAWSSANTTIGSFSTGGIFNGVSAGIVAVSYTLPTGCITTLDAIVNPVAPIGGPSTVCLGQSMQLTESAGAGTWSSSSVSIATVGTTGVVKGIAANLSATITYTFCTGCKTYKLVSVNPLSSIAGATGVCQGYTTLMTDATAGGTWSSSAAGVLNFASTNGNVTGVNAGTATIYYILPTGCTSAMTMTVNPLMPISGPNGVCSQKTISLSDLVPGGAWSSLAPTIASVGATSGVVTGASLANSSTTITYTTSAGCRATKLVSVYALPSAPPAIGGPAAVSISGSPVTLTNTTTGGTWSSNNIARATVGSATGVVTGVGVGTVIITYSVTNPNGCSNQATKMITVGTSAPGSEGNSLITENVPLSDGNILLIPNPNKGEFTIKGNLNTITDEEITIEVVDILGQSIYKGQVKVVDSNINEHVVLKNTIANGRYLLNLHSSGEHYVIQFVVER